MTCWHYSLYDTSFSARGGLDSLHAARKWRTWGVEALRDRAAFSGSPLQGKTDKYKSLAFPKRSSKGLALRSGVASLSAPAASLPAFFTLPAASLALPLASPPRDLALPAMSPAALLADPVASPAASLPCRIREC